MQARYYDPLIGRFYSDDPLAFRDIHSFNRYTYANNNPYKYIDPDGKNAKSFGAIAKIFKPSSGDPKLDRAINLVDAGFPVEAALAHAGIQFEGNATASSVKGETGSSNGKRRGKRHTKAGIRVAKNNNAKMNNGVVTCTTCGVETTATTRRTRGSTVAKTEGQADHTDAKSNGGNGATAKEQSNINIKCSECNLKKSNN